MILNAKINTIKEKFKNIRMLDRDLEVTVENEWIVKFNSGFLTK